MWISTKKLGDTGELIAIEYLQKHGYTIKETNYKFGRFGEIDVIATHANFIYFFEVKYRTNSLYGKGEESITKQKLYKIRKSAEAYCNSNRIDYDVMKIEALVIEKHERSHRIKHYRNLEF